MLPTLALVVAAGFGLLRDVVALVVLLALCLGGMVASYVLWVPLVAEQLSSPAIVQAGRNRIAAQHSAIRPSRPRTGLRGGSSR
jgi:hypothetical protein